jgi:GntR family transcriptional repressor for pyruvate dehydrogenase complex
VAPADSETLFAPLAREPAYTRVSSEIERKIMARQLEVGELLPPETEIARQFGVHRSTVREALRRLESAGLLSRRTGSKRMVVTRPDHGEVASGLGRALLLSDVRFADVWEAMMLIEPEIAALAAERRLADHLDALARVQREFAASPDGDPEAVRLVGRFFDIVANAAGNPVLGLAAQPLVLLLEPSLAQMIDRVAQARRRIREAHAAILAAIERRDRDEARQWMLKHVRDFQRGLELAGIAMNRAVAQRPAARRGGKR